MRKNEMMVFKDSEQTLWLVDTQAPQVIRVSANEPAEILKFEDDIEGIEFLLENVLPSTKKEMAKV